MRVCVVVLLTLLLGEVAHARPDCEGEARELRAFLTAEARRADTWNTLWALGFGAATAGQIAVVQAETNPFGEFDAAYREQLIVGSVKASLGLGSKLVFALKLDVPAKAADACEDVRVLHEAIAHAAQKERKSILLTIIGGTIVNLSGAIWLWARHDLKTAATSFATGVPIGPISALTQPRGAMKLYKRKRGEWASRDRVHWVVGLGWIGGAF